MGKERNKYNKQHKIGSKKQKQQQHQIEQQHQQIEQQQHQIEQLHQQIKQQNQLIEQQKLKIDQQQHQIQQLQQQHNELYQNLQQEQQKSSMFANFIQKLSINQAFSEIKTIENNISYLQITLNNLKRVFQSIPHSSPIRKQLLKYLKHNNNINFLSKITGESPQTISKSNKSIDFNTKKQQISNNSTSFLNFQQMESVLDSICPIMSGRNYRKLCITQSELYQKYLQQATTQFPAHRPGSREHFRKFLKKENIHYSPEANLCPYCEESLQLDNQDQLTEEEIQEKKNLENHKRISKNSTGFFF